VKVTGGHDTRVSLAALIAVRPGCRPRLIFRTHRARRGDKRKGFTETDKWADNVSGTRNPGHDRPST
jgi:hypothetical protein